jgi:hypothetical protein
MIRAYSAIVAFVICATGALPATADDVLLGPTGSGAGTQRGLAQQNNSGEVGTVTLFRRGPSSTLVVIRVSSEPLGRQQPAHVHRGHDCATLDPKPAYGLAPVINGLSKTIVNEPEDKLLSGNYVVNVHAAADNIARYVSCGELYR